MTRDTSPTVIQGGSTGRIGASGGGWKCRLGASGYDDLLETLTPRVLDLIEAIRREQPASINETARVVDRDVKNVHEERSRIAQLGIIFYEEDGQSKNGVILNGFQQYTLTNE